jgi:HAD superfamily hydrolase (TIGR01509 family)
LSGHSSLSFEEKTVKPDPSIFRTACRRLVVTPEVTLMVGDSEESDGGAARAGLQVMILPPARLPDPRGMESVLERLR